MFLALGYKFVSDCWFQTSFPWYAHIQFSGWQVLAMFLTRLWDFEQLAQKTN
jgi:hypothetical protein